MRAGLHFNVVQLLHVPTAGRSFSETVDDRRDFSRLVFFTSSTFRYIHIRTRTSTFDFLRFVFQ